jgi:hypothetical protein
MIIRLYYFVILLGVNLLNVEAPFKIPGNCFAGIVPAALATNLAATETFSSGKKSKTLFRFGAKALPTKSGHQSGSSGQTWKG